MKITKARTFVGLSSIVFSTPASILGAPANNGHYKPSPRKTLKKAVSAVKSRVLVQVQSGVNNHQDSPDNSVHIGRQDNRRFTSKTYNQRTYITQVINKTIVIKEPSGTQIGLELAPASPEHTDDPMTIPFVVSNRGTAPLYNLRAICDIRHYRFFSVGNGVYTDSGPDDQGHFSIERYVTANTATERATYPDRPTFFGSKDHFRFDVNVFGFKVAPGSVASNA